MKMESNRPKGTASNGYDKDKDNDRLSSLVSQNKPINASNDTSQTGKRIGKRKAYSGICICSIRYAIALEANLYLYRSSRKI